MKETTIIEELKAGNPVVIHTVGVSMRPLLIERQTHVRLRPLTQAKNRDILLYLRKNGSMVLHRLIKQDKTYYYMRGDNTYGLERIERSQAIGVAEEVYRKGKSIDVSSNFFYKLYVWTWIINYPLRFAWMKMKTYAARLRHKLKKK